MNVGICVCVLLAALSSSSLSLPLQPAALRAEREAPPTHGLSSTSSLHTRHARSASAPPYRKLANYNQPQDDTGPHISLSQLLAMLMSKKGCLDHTRSSLTSRASGPGPNQRIKDRDYQGWMDFGRRSAEEYEYSS
ncbi:cholecystokinin [Polymixia lowei]